MVSSHGQWTFKATLYKFVKFWKRSQNSQVFLKSLFQDLPESGGNKMEILNPLTRISGILWESDPNLATLAIHIHIVYFIMWIISTYSKCVLYLLIDITVWSSIWYWCDNIYGVGVALWSHDLLTSVVCHVTALPYSLNTYCRTTQA